MKGRFFATFVFFSLFMVRSAFPQNLYYLSHVANGAFSGGSFRTTFVLFNNNDASVVVVLKLTDDKGNPLTVNITGLGTNSQFTLNLDAAASKMLQTDGSGNLVAGAATVSSTATIGVTAIFTIYDLNGNFVTESGVGSSQPMTEFVIPVDVTGTFDTGLALFNPSSGSASITLSLFDTGGRAFSSPKTQSLSGGAHSASFVDQLFPVSNFRGTLVVQSSLPISALTLRQNSSPLSYTSLPVVPRSSSQTSMNFPQAANGSYGGISFKTSFLIFNISSSPANVVLTLTQDNGSPFTVTIPGTGTNSSFSITLAAGASVFLQTDGLGAGTAGAATITSNVPVGAAAIFTVLNSQGQFQTEAGVGDSRALTELTLPVDITGNFDTGVAFFNPGSSSLTMALRLMDSNGVNVGSSATVSLAAKNHTARFVSQLFPGTSNFRGSVAISAPGGVAALTLRQNSSPLSYTTLPVASGTARGKTQVAPLLSVTRTGLSLTSNQIINQVLPAGYRLSGRITGSGKPDSIVAQSGATSIFSGPIDSATGKYLIVVPDGSYTLKVSYQPVLTAVGVTSLYTDPTSPVQVHADTTHDVTLPSLNLFKVSGTISGLANITPSATSLSVEFTSDTALGTFRVDSSGNYQGSLPAGSYQVGIDASGIQFAMLQSATLQIDSIGSLTVSGDVTAPPFSIPATAKLLGKIQGASLTLPLFATVTGGDISTPQTTIGSTAADMMTGQYQMLLVRNRTYSLGTSVGLVQGETAIGVVLFPVPAGHTLNLSGDATLDFNLPAFPAQVTISGQVTDSSGHGVGGVSVGAYSQTLTGGANLGFAGGAETDSNGNYRFVVLSGTNYQLTFVPRTPAP